MHRPEYIKLIEAAALTLGIDVKHLSDNWAMQLSKNGVTKFIVGNTFPLNDSACYKIAGNKNLCSDILTENNIANVPHQVMFSPSVLERRRSEKGNFEIIQQFISENGFPLLIKKNNSTKGEGVYFLNNEAELENALTKVYATDSTLCLSPYRENIREYRNIVLDGVCLLSYEKQIPFVTGDNKSSIIELLSEFVKKNSSNAMKPEKFFDTSLMNKMNYIPMKNEKIFLQWRHNRFLGTRYEVVDNPEIQKLAINAAKAITARFASVDIIHSEKFGLEILEMSPSVSIHFPIFSPATSTDYDKEVEVYRLALKETFNLK